MTVTPGAAGSWEITSKIGVSPWVAGVNGCHSFSSEEAAKINFTIMSAATKSGVAARALKLSSMIGS